MKAFLDTNIVLDLLCTREPFAKDAAAIFKMGYEQKLELYISPLTFINTLYICRRYGYKSEDIITSLKKIASFCKITSMGNAEISKAIEQPGSDFEDAVQLQSAISAGAECIVTRDKKGYSSSPITVLTPQEIIFNSH